MTDLNSLGYIFKRNRKQISRKIIKKQAFVFEEILNARVEFDFSGKRTGINKTNKNLSILLFTLYRSFDEKLQKASFLLRGYQSKKHYF